jgi:hypothetical protein
MQGQAGAGSSSEVPGGSAADASTALALSQAGDMLAALSRPPAAGALAPSDALTSLLLALGGMNGGMPGMGAR